MFDALDKGKCGAAVAMLQDLEILQVLSDAPSSAELDALPNASPADSSNAESDVPSDALLRRMFHRMLNRMLH